MSKDDNDSILNDARLDTLAIRAGQSRSAEGEHSEPVFTTSSYVLNIQMIFSKPSRLLPIHSKVHTIEICENPI